MWIYAAAALPRAYHYDMRQEKKGSILLRFWKILFENWKKQRVWVIMEPAQGRRERMGDGDPGAPGRNRGIWTGSKSSMGGQATRKRAVWMAPGGNGASIRCGRMPRRD